MHSLRVKLIAPFIIGTLALTLFLAWYTYNSARMAVEESALVIAEAKTANAVASMSLLFKSTMTSLQNMVVDPHVMSFFVHGPGVTKTKTADWLEIITQGNEYYRDILIVDRNGICISSSNPGHIGNSYMDHPYVQRALSGMFNFGEAAIGKVTKRLSVILAGPIDSEGLVVGALVIFSDFPRIVDYGKPKNGKRPTYQMIATSFLASDGLFTANIDQELMDNEKKKFPEIYDELVRVGEKGGPVSYELEGNTYWGYAQMESNTGWLVISSGRQSQVLASAYRVGLMVFSISFAFLCLVSFVVLKLANGILSSLLSLIGYAKDVSEGNIDQELEPSKRNDELGILQSSLVSLVDSLHAMIEKSQEASELKGQFLANMSHEIRTPLNAIIGMVHLSTARGDQMPEEQRGYLDKIQLAAKSLLGIINDILDFSKVEAGMLQLEETAFDLKETVVNIVSIHQDSANAKNIKLVIDYPAELPTRFIGDPVRIGQILNNLLSNAVKFTLEGSIAVHVREEQALEQGRTIMHMDVSDTGIGMSQEAIGNLFRPFTQADASITRKFGGTGLGLAISDSLVKQMGGRFTVSSAESKGTTFSFYIDLKLDDQDPAAKIQELPLDQAFEQLNLDNKQILVAEDNKINQFILQKLLAPSRAQISLADNGLKAVEAVQAQTYDLIFMDVQMPIMDGLEATRIIRTLPNGRDIPIIAVTANAMEADKSKGLQSGMNDYLTKPIEPKNLLKVLSAWLGR